MNYNYVFLFYDIKETRVNKVFKVCKKYLTHYQNSVFKGEITPSNILELENNLKRTIKPEEDFIVLIKLTNKNSFSETILGTKKNTTDEIFL